VVVGHKRAKRWVALQNASTLAFYARFCTEMPGYPGAERIASPEFDLCVLPISVLESRASFEHRVLEDTEDCPRIEAELGLTIPKLRSHLSAADVSTWSLPEAVSVCGCEVSASQSIHPSMRTRKPNHTAQRTRRLRQSFALLSQAKPAGSLALAK
jgi:hypothetical protein